MRKSRVSNQKETHETIWSLHSDNKRVWFCPKEIVNVLAKVRNLYNDQKKTSTCWMTCHPNCSIFNSIKQNPKKISFANQRPQSFMFSTVFQPNKFVFRPRFGRADRKERRTGRTLPSNSKWNRVSVLAGTASICFHRNSKLPRCSQLKTSSNHRCLGKVWITRSGWCCSSHWNILQVTMKGIHSDLTNDWTLVMYLRWCSLGLSHTPIVGFANLNLNPFA